MDVNEMTFGVEFEVTLPRNVISTVGGYHRGVQIPGLPEGWNAQSDASIHTNRRGYMGVEVVSPILKGADGLKQIVAVCNWLNVQGAKVNKSTGLHVHVGFRGSNTELNNVVHMVANHEKAVFAATGTVSREQGHFCKSIARDPGYIAKFRDATQPDFRPGRYHLLNLTNLGTIRNTVEFRAFAGTTDAVKAVGYVRLCLGLVEKGMKTKRTAKWTAKQPVATSPIYRKGAGLTALARLFYGLGWTKGDNDFVFGNIEAEGVPTIIQTKDEFKRLARKYDLGTEG